MIKAKDIASHAGVSLATVDRVLNGRPGVSARTLLRVRASIKALGYVPNANAVALVKGVKARLLFLIPKGPGTFITSLSEQLAAAKEAFLAQQVQIKVQVIPPLDPQALCEQLNQIDRKQVDGVALVVSEGDGVRWAIDRLRAQGVYVVTLVSDALLSRRDYFVGVDNLAAGRTAGSLMSKFLLPQGGPAAVESTKAGKIALVLGSQLLRDHVERQIGFLQVVQGRMPKITVLPPIEGYDRHEIVEHRLSALLRSQPDIVGIYSAGAGVRGLIAALDGLPSDRPICTIAHELTQVTRQALESGKIDAILAQDPGHEVRSAIRLLVSLVTRVPAIEAQERISLDIIIRENLP